jgi:hypothetical protein
VLGQEGSLAGSLDYVGVVTSPVVVVTSPISTPGTTPQSKLSADLQALQTELESLAAKSGVTIADLQSLALDGQSIATAGFRLNSKTLNPVISELATAIAGGASTMPAQTAFTALFSSSKVSSSVITATFNDLVTTIQDSKVTTADLTTVAADEAAIQTDLGNLHTGSGSGSGGGTTGSGSTGSTGSGSTGSGSTGTGSTGTGTTGTGSTGHKKGAGPHAHTHKPLPTVKVKANAHGHSKLSDARTKG